LHESANHAVAQDWGGVDTAFSKKERKSIHGDISARYQWTGVAVQSYQGKVQQLTDITVRHLAHFRRIAVRLLGNIADAEDAVQDAFLSAFTHLDQFRGQAKMTTWLTAIVINAARMKLRRRSPQVQMSLDETHGERSVLLAEMLPDHQPNPEEVCGRRELAEKLADATTQLSPTLRKIFQLRDLDGLSISETAHLLGVPGGTVKAQLARGRVRLKEIVRKSLRGNGDAIRSTDASAQIVRDEPERWLIRIPVKRNSRRADQAARNLVSEVKGVRTCVVESLY
jgi:RNA polymerase sigma-70 factor, ECF subfamily